VFWSYQRICACPSESTGGLILILISGQKVYEETGGVDMCKAMERKEKRDEVNGAIKALKLYGVSEEDIITKVNELFGVTREYVLALLKAQEA